MSFNEFCGIGGYQRAAEGYMSWQHLTFVSALMLLMVSLAVFFGNKYKNKEDKYKNRVLIASAIFIDGLEIFKIVMISIRNNDPMTWIRILPLFMCSIQLITIPLAAFAKGRLKDVALDFVTVFGVLGAVLGTYFAGNNYSVYPVMSIDNVMSGLTHSIAGFVALYIMISGMLRMHKKDIALTSGILGVFCIFAYVANIFLDCNYMFLSRGDGTPYDIFYNLVGGSPIIYPIIVVALFVLYITLFYYSYYAIKKCVNKKTDD